jgi:hypothetical protein
MATPLPQPLQRAPITSARRLSPDRPVFLIGYSTSATTTAQFVVKAETSGVIAKGVTADVKNAVQSSIMLMRDAARGARGRVLTEGERRDFLQAARPLLGSAADQTYLDVLRDEGTKLLWMLLGFKAGLVDLQGVIDSQAVLRACQVLLSLRDDENLDRLGRILATDLFLNNNDRFSIKPNESSIQNLGNVFFVDKGNGTFKIKGLDVFDPSSNNALMSTTVRKGCDRMDSRDENYWSGPLLKDPDKRARVAQNALDSLYAELGGVLREAKFPEPLIRNYKFSESHTKVVVKGMEAALVVIKASCKLRLAQMRAGKVNADGLKSRMKVMGWST